MKVKGLAKFEELELKIEQAKASPEDIVELVETDRTLKHHWLQWVEKQKRIRRREPHE